MCKQYLLSEGNISKWKEVKLDNIQDFISECNSKDDISQTNITSNKNRMSREDIIRFDGWVIDLGDTDNKTLYDKCDKCGSSMYANMKFGVVELECENCGYYKEI